MMKRRMVCLFVTVMAAIGVATAQSHPVHSSSSRKGSAAIKPLTPKSAMPTSHKSTGVTASNSGIRNTNSEINHLERHNNSGPKNTAPKVAPVRTAKASAGKGSGINDKYQKPIVNKNPSR